MRKLILISAFVLASMSAHAGESRNMTLAANDETRAVETAKPQDTQAQQTNAQESNADVKTDAAKPEGSRHYASRQAGKSHVRGYEADEAKARRIAARYGVYW
ncbi:hypothetical protein [Bradyrhizobium sp. AZCC 2289]|uniref:hypothetical protein n=1 Tax=Bradyrhizobium sp. AZCC 2289 TaxID=3117026 RepID=UPI002FF3B587